MKYNKQKKVLYHKQITLVTVGLSAGVEGKKAERIKVKKQELADKTLTMPASVSAKAA